MSTGYVDTKPCRVFFSARMNGSSSSSCRSLSFSFHIDRDEYPAPVHASVAGMTPSTVVKSVGDAPASR